MTIEVSCCCGAVEMQITGNPIMQYVCHCDDCQAVHGKAYSISLFHVPNVRPVEPIFNVDMPQLQ